LDNNDGQQWILPVHGYMLNKYEIFIYWTKTNSIRLVYQMENTVWIWKLATNWSYHVKRHIVYIPNCVLLNVLTNEDCLNGKYSMDYHYLGKNMKTCNKLVIHVKRHIVYIPNCVLLDVLTSEDSLNGKYSIDYHYLGKNMKTCNKLVISR
jgi:hypothetical protein